MRNKVVNDNYLHNGVNIKLAQNGLTRRRFNKGVSLKASKVKMNAHANYLNRLMFSCKFKHYLCRREYYSTY